MGKILTFLFISQNLTLSLELERDTFCPMEPVFVNIYLKNEDKIPVKMIPLEHAFYLLTLEVEEIGKGLLDYKGLHIHIIGYPVDTLYPGETQNTSRNITYDYANEYSDDIKKSFLREGKYSVRAIFKVAVPLKGTQVQVKKVLTSPKKYFVVAVPQRERKEWEEYIKAIKSKDVSYKLKFVENYPASRFAENILYSLCEEMYSKTILKIEKRENALKILKKMALDYPNSRYTPGIPIRIWLLFKNNEKDKAKEILDSLIKARPNGKFVENAKKIIEKHPIMY